MEGWVEETVTLQRTDFTKSLECVSVTFLHREQSFDYQDGSPDKTDLISSNRYVRFNNRRRKSEQLWVVLPSSVLAGRHCVRRTWANKARNRSTLGLISILLRELQLLAALRLQLHSDLWGISAGSFTGRRWGRGREEEKLINARARRGRSSADSELRTSTNNNNRRSNLRHRHSTCKVTLHD